MESENTEIFMQAFAPYLLHITSIDKNIIQLNTNPQSRAKYWKFINSLFAIRFAQISATVKIQIVMEGMFLRRIL